MRIRAKYTEYASPTRINRNMIRALQPALAQAGMDVQRQWRRAIPHDWPGKDGHPTYETAKSITWKRPNQKRVSIGTNTISGRGLELGMRPHAIPARPSNKRKQLWWPDSRGGRSIQTDFHHDPPGWRYRNFVAWWKPRRPARGIGREAIRSQWRHIQQLLQTGLNRTRIP